MLNEYDYTLFKVAIGQYVNTNAHCPDNYRSEANSSGWYKMGELRGRGSQLGIKIRDKFTVNNVNNF